MIAVLYITYDGLLDPLGSSQILPYVKSIAQSQGGVVILSFEKTDRFESDAASKASEISNYPISWKPLRFTSGMGLIGKMWDLSKMYFWGFILARRFQVKVVHARGHLATQIGLLIRRILSVKLIFDFRGLWVDERIDKGGWDLGRMQHRFQYNYYKRVERQLLTSADHVVVLTNMVVNEVVRLGVKSVKTTTVIPCCADFEHFPLATPLRRILARADIGIPADARVFGYLGSVGRMYRLDRFFRLFEMATELGDDYYAFVVTQDVQELLKIMNNCLSRALHARVFITAANRSAVPNIIPAMDILVSFIQPSYARMAASPTKHAECFAEGIPIICNDGIGDIVTQIKDLEAGIIVDPESEIEMRATAAQFDSIRLMGGQRLREKARPSLGLAYAEEQYRSVYSHLSNTR
jgi:glycosyltransferase involved in cell wall biosynthesis